MIEEEAGWNCVLEFTDPSERFCLGFEAGCLWEILKRRDVSSFGHTCHALNDEQIIKMARVQGWRLEIHPLDDGWIECVFNRQEV